jgi:hypothetical protein
MSRISGTRQFVIDMAAILKDWRDQASKSRKSQETYNNFCDTLEEVNLKLKDESDGKIKLDLNKFEFE